MKKVLLLLLCLVFVVSLVEAKIVSDSVYQIPKTKIVPTIDGVEDAVWKTLDWNQQRLYFVDGTFADSGASVTGMSKAMWDANNFYLLFYTVDDIAIDIPANPGWNQDAIEFYIDGDNTKIADGVSPDPGGGLAPGDYQFTIPHWMIGTEAGRLGQVFGTAFDTVGVEFMLRDVPDNEGYVGTMYEVKIPLASLGIDGSTAADQLIGWELQQDESDDATIGRQHMTKWWSSSNNSWSDASLWGTAILAGREVDSTLAINKTAATIAVDGQMDAAYKNANPVNTGIVRVGDPPAADALNTDPLLASNLTAYPLWDMDNFYCLIEVVDNIVTPIPANPGWNQDAIEIYFDADNSKIPNGVSPDPGGGLAPGDYQFTIPYWMIGTEDGRLGQIFGTAFDTVGAAFKIVDRDARGNSGELVEAGSGYNVEMKIPLASLGIDGSSPGAVIGFELQMDNANDATVGRGQMQKWWHNSNNSWTDASLWGTAQLVLGTVDVKESPASVISSYNLNQNYPNPFNPSTEISYSIPNNAKVKLAVYNLLGKQVAELVNGTQVAGPHAVNFSAANLSSGVYFYKLEVGNTVLSKKMMLLK
jgi:hypothetical protein